MSGRVHVPPVSRRPCRAVTSTTRLRKRKSLAHCFLVIVQLPLYRSNQALDIFKKTLDIWKVMKYAGVDECEGAPESGGWTKAA